MNIGQIPMVHQSGEWAVLSHNHILDILDALMAPIDGVRVSSPNQDTWYETWSDKSKAYLKSGDFQNIRERNALHRHSFSNYFSVCLFSWSVVSDSFVIPWTVAHQAPLSMGFPGQGYWSGLPCSSPGDLPNPGIKPSFLHCRQILYQLSYKGSP